MEIRDNLIKAARRFVPLANLMAVTQFQSPGTVSKILWHFTGGPTWNATEQRQNKRRKPDEKAYESLKGIISDKQLRIGQYKEVVNVIIPQRRSYDFKTKKFTTERDVPVKLTSAPVCCLADIPIIHLAYHAFRYGKFAIGFHRDAVVNHGFNPVFYTLPDTTIIRSVYEGFSQLKFADVNDIKFAVSDIENDVNNLDSDELDISNSLSEIEYGSDDIERYIDEAKDSFEQILAFIKTFDEDEFGSVYCEREWRSVESYRFDFDEIAMVVVPKNVGKRKYFQRLIARDAASIKLPRSIPIVPWEDLVEH